MTDRSPERRRSSARWRAAASTIVFGIPGGAILPAYDPLFDSQAAPPHPRPARAGRRPRGRGLRAGHRPGRRLHGDQRPGRDQPRHADRRRLHGLGADRRDHRPGAVGGDRHRRLPGSRHLRHHDADHQAQLPRHRRRRHPAGDRRGVPHRLAPAGRARSSSTSPRTRCRRTTTFSWPVEMRPAGLPPGGQAARQAGPRGGAADRRARSGRCSTSAAACSRRARPRSCGCSPSSPASRSSPR